jgi:hypothetical protein
MKNDWWAQDPETLKMLSLSGLGKRPQGISVVLSLVFKIVVGIFLTHLVCVCLKAVK